MKNNTLALLVLLATACSPIVTTHGNMLHEQTIAEIQPESSTRVDVQSRFGPPTTVSAFDPNTWYYIGETDSRKGVFRHTVQKRQLLKITFNPDDTVKEIALLDPAQAQEIEISERKTRTAGKEFNAFQQFVGNIGKFNPNTVQK